MSGWEALTGLFLMFWGGFSAGALVMLRAERKRNYATSIENYTLRDALRAANQEVTRHRAALVTLSAKVRGD